MKKFIFILCVLAGLSACETVIDLEVPNSDPRMVVESSISNDTTFWTARLSWSQAYFDQEKVSGITDAQVTIMDDLGLVDTLFHSDTGLYVSKVKRNCKIGRNYTLKIVHQGREYRATEKCKFQEPISFLMSFEFKVPNGFIDAGFYVFEKAEESAAAGDYYMWKIYKNDSLQELFGYLLDTDEFRESSFFNLNIDPDDPLKDMDKNILPRPFPIDFELGDIVRIEQYNISKNYYYFLLELQNQLSRSGTPFDAPPVNPRSNLSGGAFGFFSVSNLSKATIEITQ